MTLERKSGYMCALCTCIHPCVCVCVCVYVSGRGGALVCHVYVFHLLSLMTDKLIQRIDVNIICLKPEEIFFTTKESNN